LNTISPRVQKISTLALLLFVPWAIKVGKNFKTDPRRFCPKIFKSTPAHVRMGRRSARRPPNTIEVELESKSGMKNRLHMFPPRFYFRFSQNCLFLALAKQIKARLSGLRASVLFGPTSFAFQRFSLPKPCSKFKLGPLGLAIHLFRRLSTKPQLKCKLGSAGIAFRASQFHKCPSPHFFAISMFILWSRTCCDYDHAECQVVGLSLVLGLV